MSDDIHAERIARLRAALAAAAQALGIPDGQDGFDDVPAGDGEPQRSGGQA